jgi:mitochondrial fission protein ELM1
MKASCWVITEGYAGTQNQALGIADALGLDPLLKRVSMRQPWRSLPARLWIDRIGTRALEGDPLAPPWPDVLISCGRHGAVASCLVRRQSGGATFTIHVQAPPLAARRFDVLVVPRHDSFAAANVVHTEAAIHRISRAALDSAAAAAGSRWEHLPRPRVTVLIGGSNGRYRLRPARMAQLAAQLGALAAEGAGLLITPSRRTDPRAWRVLGEQLVHKNAVLWDGSGDNPYLAFLGLADYLLVTRDSVSMTSEALATGRPVYVIDLEGRSRRIERFHASMERAGYTRRFAGRLEHWSYDPPCEAERAAAQIRPLLDARLDGLRAVLRERVA